MTRCAFCAISENTADGAIVLRSDAFLAFLDKRPLFPGHLLLVPRRHVGTLAELSSSEAALVMPLVQRLSHALEVALDAQGTFVALNDRVSQSVAHVHVHVVPRRAGDGLKGFFWPRHPYASLDERDAIARRLQQAL